MSRRLLLCLGFLGLAGLLAGFGVSAAGRFLGHREEARYRVARALRAGHPESESTREALFAEAQALDPGSDVAACAEGDRLARWGHWEDATAKFRRCIEGDPGQPFAHLAYAETLLAARGRDAYPEVRAELRRFLAGLGESPNLADKASQRAAEERILEIEALLADSQAASHRATFTAEEIAEILARPKVRGSSRYDEPRVPLRLAFRPGDFALGAEAEAQLQTVGRALKDGLVASDRVQIEGHTDSVEGGSRGSRLILSRERAQAVRRYLIDRCGIAAQRLTIAALADDYPLDSNDTRSGQATNRRVELVDLEEKRVILRDVRTR